MSYHGAPMPGSGGYWNGNGHGPPNPPPYGVHEMRSQPAQNGARSQYQTPSSNGQIGQYQNPLPQYAQAQGNMPAVHSANRVHTSAPTQPASQQPQFINPAHLFSQPPAQSIQPYQPIQLTPHSHQALNTLSKPSPGMAHMQPPNMELDRPKLLMSLAEEFFDAAHQLAPSASLSMTSANVETYEKLISTGLGCLDTALKNVRLPPRVEANIRLRYAGVLYEETENFMEAEISLSKGIALCDRNHYYDLKYAMQFLLAQFMFKKNPKASLKALDGYISDAEAYQHFSWVYALRFLRAAHSLQSGSLADNHAALQNFRSIAKLASEQNDRVIYMMASLMEAMAHLKFTGPESMEHAQRAIAAVWTYQLDAGTRIPQLLGLAHILDVACSLRQGDPKVMVSKLKLMQTMMDEALHDPTWSTTSDVLALPINRTQNSSQVVSPDTRMVLGIGDDGRDNLILSFLNKKDAYSITYLLSGMVLLHKNSPNDRKGFRYLETGISSLEAEIRASRATSGILPDCISKLQWRGQTICYLNCYMAFCAAAITDWPAVKSYIDKARATAKNLEVSLAGPLGFLLMYLTGVYHQGIGNLDVALQIFQDKKFELLLEANRAHTTSSAEQVERDIALLAALNTLWILQDSRRKNLTSNTNLIARLEPLCKNHPNQDIETAFNLVVATVETYPTAPLFKVKNCLRAALNGAQATANTQFLSITLNVMCSRFFSNVVGAQAEKSAQAASVQAQKSGNVLWRSVADGMLAQCYEVNGKTSDAKSTMDQAMRLAQIAMPSS